MLSTQGALRDPGLCWETTSWFGFGHTVSFRLFTPDCPFPTAILEVCPSSSEYLSGRISNPCFVFENGLVTGNASEVLIVNQLPVCQVRWIKINSVNFIIQQVNLTASWTTKESEIFVSRVGTTPAVHLRIVDRFFRDESIHRVSLEANIDT